MPGRLSLAVEQGHVALPEGAVLVLGASAGCDLASLDKSDSFVLWRHFSDHVWLEQQGWTTGLTPKAGYAGAVVFAPRARDLQKAFIKLARKLTAGPIIVDGTKTDGIDALYKFRDALNWAPDTSADVVVTNPPFHKGRAATPELGQGFIRAAARVLKPKGALWLVANRHLPYEKTLDEAFASQEVVAQNAGFKVIRADRPRPPFKGK